jgi:hypothetical protein
MSMPEVVRVQHLLALLISDIDGGGKLILTIGPESNKQWGIANQSIQWLFLN